MNIFIGNSHLDQFMIIPSNTCQLISLPGASIKGLINPVSLTGLNRRIYAVCHPTNTMVFHLGQVDFEFGYYYKSALANKKLDKAAFITETINIYSEFLDTISSKKIIIGLNPTVIDDMRHTFNVNFKDRMCFRNNTIQGTGEFDTGLTYEGLSHIYDDDIDVRNEFLLLANNALKEMCHTKSIIFYNVWDALISTDTSRIKECYHPKRLDHHIVPTRALGHQLEVFIQSASGC